MTTVSEIMNAVTELSGHPLNRDEGVHHGRADREVRGVTVCWMASPAAIEAAGRQGHQLLIGHESLYFPYDVVNLPNPPPGWQDWQTNRQRRKALEKWGLAFLRVHGSADEISIFDDFAGRLGLGAPVYVAEDFVKVYEIEPCPLGQLVERVKAATGMPRLRVSPAGSYHRIVHRVGLPWGGLGLFVNVSYQHRLIEQGCDVFIAGEADNYGFRFSEECGIPMIETSHEISENPGLRLFTEKLAEALPGVEFRFFENPIVWEII